MDNGQTGGDALTKVIESAGQAYKESEEKRRWARKADGESLLWTNEALHRSFSGTAGVGACT